MSEAHLLLYALLGIVQGVVEWFPLSSSGQISLVLQHAGATPVHALSTALWIHFGSLLAIVVRFREDFVETVRIAVSPRRFLSRRMEEGGERDKTARFLILGTVFTGVTGIPAYVAFFEWFSKNPQGKLFTLLVGVLLIITGVTLFAGSRMRRGMRGEKDLVWVDGALTGLAQGFAVLPGISRSGFTVAALLGRRIDKAEALRLSFLLDAPAILGAMILTYNGSIVFTLPMLLAVLGAFVVSYFFMGAFIAFARGINLSRFCIIYGSMAAGAAVVQMLI